MALALTSFQVVVFFLAAVVFIAAAVSDARSYRIPNYLCAVLLALFPVYALTTPVSVDWRAHALVFALVALAGFALFSAHVLGAGDVKLISAASLWAGPQFVGFLIVVTALAGGIESLLMALALHLELPQTHRMRHLTKGQIPYGIAIATGGLATLGVMAHSSLLPD